MNPFVSEAAARRYVEGRPDYSTLVSDIIRRLIGDDLPLDLAVDVGSGTGISTMAIAPFARRVIGVEPSPAMVRLAIPADNVIYRIGTAEDLPVEDSAADLISVGSALHWFDQERFLAEASRVGRQEAWLIVYDHWFTARMQEHEEFVDWVRDVYLVRYPSPPRDRSWRPPDDLGLWRHTSWERFEHPVAFDIDQLAAYLMTQSNLQTVIERGERTEEKLRSWLVSEVSPFFGDDRSAHFVFGGFVAGHRRLRNSH